MKPLELPRQPTRALVIDTNIALDMLVFADPHTAALRRLLAERHWPWLATPAMRAELQRVLAYPQIAPRVAHYGLSSAGVLAAYEAQVTWVEPAARAPYACSDADDQPFIDLACAHAAVLLSRDKAVLSLRQRLARLGAHIAPTLQLTEEPLSP